MSSIKIKNKTVKEFILITNIILFDEISLINFLFL